MHGDRAPGDRVVLQRPAHDARLVDGTSVVREGHRAGVGERTELGELGAVLALRDRGHEADWDMRLGGGACAQAAQDVGVVDDRVGVRHRQDRAVATGGCGCRSGCDRLLVFAAGRAQVDVRIDERRDEQTPVALDDEVCVRIELLSDLRDHAVVDANVENRVDSLAGIDDPCAADDDVVVAAAT